MHEIAIANDLLGVACEEARRAGAVRVNRVFVQIGAMRSIDRQIIQEAWAAASEGSLCARARLELNVCPTRVECQNCERRDEIDDWPGHCPACASESGRVIGGDELELTRIDVDLDDVGPADGGASCEAPSGNTWEVDPGFINSVKSRKYGRVTGPSKKRGGAAVGTEKRRACHGNRDRSENPAQE